MAELMITGFFEIRWLDIIDILLVAVLLYLLYNLVKGTVAISIFFGIVAIFLIWKVVDALQMQLLREILGAFISVGFIALIIIFQPEIRQFLLTLGKGGFIRDSRRRFLWWRFADQSKALDIDKVVQACQKMSNIKQGALIVLTRQNELFNIVETGETIDAKVSPELLETIFFHNSPLHDGAVIITDNHLRAARCILPVSRSQKLAPSLGMRHRAAVGVTEHSDAIALVVSEENGKISYAEEGKLHKNVTPAQLHDHLKDILGNHQER
jgi:uncharacterized protein (TIGR00159 family)